MITNEELIAKARRANSPEELLALAKENDMELTEESAEAYFEQFHKSGELSDDELDNVSGGGCYKGDRLIVTMKNACDEYKCANCGKRVRGGRCMNSKNHHCHANNRSHAVCCNTCAYCSYEKGMWLCNNPVNCK